MLSDLETRLDNVVYHLGFGNSRAQARQMVCHGHVKVNGRKVNIPSYALKVNDVIEAKDTNVSRQMATRSLESSTSRVVPDSRGPSCAFRRATRFNRSRTSRPSSNFIPASDENRSDGVTERGVLFTPRTPELHHANNNYTGAFRLRE